MKVIVKKSEDKTNALHDGEVQSDSGILYTFSIHNCWHCKREIETRRKPFKIKNKDGTVVTYRPPPIKEGIDSTGQARDRSCQWWIKFDQEGMPDAFCRSDHKMVKRLAAVIVLAWEGNQ